MILEQISLRDSGQFPDIICDYLEDQPQLKPFYQYRPDLSSYADVLEHKKNFSKEKRLILREQLLNQYQKAGINLSESEQVKSNIESLTDSKTFTVTTGHQLCLFTGPLYFHFKIITTIKLASELKKKYPQYHFVPVFWMASEDHDFAEINHAYIFNKKYEWQLDSEQNPVGRLTLETINDVIEQVKALASTEESRRIVDQYTTPYLESVNLAEATLKLVHSLFKEEGLVVIEPDNKVLKQEFVPIVWKDIIERQNFECLKQTNIEIKAAHYKPQINGREINFFYFSDSGRKLIKYEDGKYLILDTDLVFSPEQMQEELRHYPERFSPNVAMRPLYQETILPNLAYIGGPGELAYWLQLKRMFHHNEIPFPVLQMRETYIIAGKPFVGKVEKAGLTVTELLKPDNELIKCFLEKALVKDVKRIAAQVGDLLQELIDEAKKADALLGSEFIKYKAEQSKYMARLTKQLAEKQKEQHQQGVDKVLKLKQSVLPDGKLQERYINILSLEINGGFCIKKEMMKTAFTCLPEVKVIY